MKQVEEVRDLDNYKLVENKVPNFGDVIYKNGDWIEEDPFKVIEVFKDEKNAIINERLKEKYNIYIIFGISKDSGFRKFTFFNGSVVKSIKVKENSKKEKELIQTIKNK